MGEWADAASAEPADEGTQQAGDGVGRFVRRSVPGRDARSRDVMCASIRANNGERQAPANLRRAVRRAIECRWLRQA